MNDMTKMFKCKLCGSKEFIDHIVYHTDERLKLADTPIFNCGALGSVTTTAYITMSKCEGFNLTLEMSKDGKWQSRSLTPITHCPFCGRKLED